MAEQSGIFSLDVETETTEDAWLSMWGILIDFQKALF
jgi:hypothetical protein